MEQQSIIDYIISRLKEYPNVRFEKKNEDELEIKSESENGFDILLQSGSREYTLHFDNFHWHFDKDENETNEMINQLLFGLTGIARLKELSRNGKAYKWVLEIQDQEGNWHKNGTLGTFNFNIWHKSEVKYLQNNLLPKEIFKQ